MSQRERLSNLRHLAEDLVKGLAELESEAQGIPESTGYTRICKFGCGTEILIKRVYGEWKSFNLTDSSPHVCKKQEQS